MPWQKEGTHKGKKSVERNIYLFDIERVKLKKRMNVRLRRCSKSLPCEEDILVTTLIGLRNKPITQQDALPRSESQPRFLPGHDPLSLFEASPLSSCLVRTSKHLHRRSRSIDN
ncbi:hypothetical protein GQ457_18G011460 [Hibiscus cannabinus]